MTRKKTKKVIGILIGLAILIFIGTRLFAIGFDDFLVEEDFSILSPALAKNPQNYVPNLPPNIEDRVYIDDVWQLNYKVDTSPSDASYNPSSIFRVTEDKKLRLSSSGKPVSALFKKDLALRDIKIKVDSSIGSSLGEGGGENIILLQGQEIFKHHFLAQDSDQKSLLIEMILDIENENLYHIVINGEEVSTVLINPTMPVNLRFEAQSRTQKYSSTSLTLHYIKSRPYFNCRIENDEVVIRDKFTEQSQFNIKALTFPPRKFCVDNYPIIKRSFTAQGSRADIQGQLTKKLVHGEVITVNKNEVIEVYYIADYKEGMGERCPIDSAYDTQDRRCVKVIEEKPDVAEVIYSKEIIIVGRNDKLFEGSINIGDKTIQFSAPTYSCQEEQPTAVSGQPRPDCWNSIVSYNGLTLPIIYGQEIQLNEFIKVKYVADAKFKDGALKDGWKNRGTVTFNKRFLSIENIGNPKDEYYVLLNNQQRLNLIIDNKLGNFGQDESGLQVRTTKEALISQNTEIREIGFNAGRKTYSIPIDTSEIGRITYEIIPYFKVDGEIFYSDERILRNFEVVTETSDRDPIIVKGSFWDKIKEFFIKLLKR